MAEGIYTKHPSGLVAKLNEYRIKSCNATDDWYKDMIGQKIKVRLFGTFGAWDEQDRWICHYDLEYLPNS